MNSISIPFEDSINAQALEHESAMVDAYTKMKPDSFKSQSKAVPTTYYEDIKGVQGGSGCHKTRIVKRRFEDQEDDAGNKGADAAAPAPARWTRCRRGGHQRRRGGRRRRRGGVCSSCTGPQPCREGGGTGC